MTITLVEWLIVPLVPLTVKLKVLLPAPEVAATVTVAVPDPVSEVGLTVAVTLGPGNPLTVKSTSPTKPPEGVRVIVNCPLDPLLTFNVDVDPES